MQISDKRIINNIKFILISSPENKYYQNRSLYYANGFCVKEKLKRGTKISRPDIKMKFPYHDLVHAKLKHC